MMTTSRVCIGHVDSGYVVYVTLCDNYVHYFSYDRKLVDAERSAERAKALISAIREHGVPTDDNSSDQSEE